MSDTMMGPTYSYADELSTPTELGISGNDGSAGGIIRAIAGVNYYTDAIGFGESTGLAKMNGMTQQPLGIRYFTKTGAKCSNGADMYQYIDTTPQGLPGRVGNEIERTLGVRMRGLAPGIMQDAAGSLNPLPMFQAMAGSAYPKCKQVTYPVGDLKGQLRSPSSGTQWITDPDTRIQYGTPHQTRWVYDSDLSREQYDAEPKTQAKEGFVNPTSLATAVGTAACLLIAAFFVTRRR
jgi:hypothetical protein